MPSEEDVLRIKKKLDRINDKLKSSDGGGSVDVGKAMDYLKRLDGFKMNLPLLTKTRIGMTVNTLRKSTDDEAVSALTKSILKAWKKFVPPENNPHDGKKKVEGRRDETARKTPDTHDEIRLGCRKILSNALRGEGQLLEGAVATPEDLAEVIETTIYEKFKETNARYKNQVRSRVFNLKDKKNPSLRENVLCGVIKPEKVAVMTSEEMASDEVKNQRVAYVKEGIDSAQLAIAEGTKTDLLKCGKCLKSNCTYNQLQTRSADEPMTTFVMCNECGHRWKFC